MKKSTKIIIITVLIILLCILIGFTSYFIYDYNRNVVFTSIDDSFTITLPNKIKPKQTVVSREDYLLDIISAKKQIFMYSTMFIKERELDFNQVVNNEKNTISSSRENVQNQSEVTNTTIANLPAYTYNYTYHDSEYNKDLYTEVYWIISNTKVYILDFECLSDSIESSKPIFQQAVNSFSLLK